jgi:hypothetical protein
MRSAQSFSVALCDRRSGTLDSAIGSAPSQAIPQLRLAEDVGEFHHPDDLSEWHVPAETEPVGERCQCPAIETGTACSTEFEATIEPKGSAQMNARILALATVALMSVAPLSGAAQAGRLTDLAKASLKQNAKLVKKSIKLNAFILKCALDKNGGCGFKDD